MTIAVKPKEAKPVGVPGLPRPKRPAHVIALGARKPSKSPRRWRRISPPPPPSATAPGPNRLPSSTLFRRAGCGRSTCRKHSAGPRSHTPTLAKVIEIISAADPSLGQIPQNHLGVVAAIRTVSEPQQQRSLFDEVLKGVRFGNAFSEFRSKRAADFETTFVDKGDHVIVTGEKFYSTGALFAHLVPIVALDDQGRAWYAIADRDAPGLTVIDDWSSFGQRATFSGTTLIDQRAGAEKPSGARLQGLRPPDGRRRDLPDHPGGGRHRHRQERDRGDHRAGARQGAGVDRQYGASAPPTIRIRFRPSAISFCGCMPRRRCLKSPVAPSTAPWRTLRPDPLPRRKWPWPRPRC